MKLEENDKTARLKPDSPILVRDVLAHLLLLSDEAKAGQKKKTVLADLYRQVAVDYLAVLRVTQRIWLLTTFVVH